MVWMAPGNSARAARLKRDTAYNDESTPGSAMTSLAAAKLLAHSAQRTTTTPLQSRPERGDWSSAATIWACSSRNARSADLAMESGLTTTSVVAIEAAGGGVEGKMSFSVKSSVKSLIVADVSLSVLKPCHLTPLVHLT